MRGEIDTSFVTSQRDLFTSGLAAQIGMDSFGVWLAIKSHADYNTGHAWPGMRRLAQITGISLGGIHKCITILVAAKLLRILTHGQGRRSARYMPRERLDVRLGSRVLCTVVIDYVPTRLRARLEGIEAHMSGKTNDPAAMSLCTIIPGPGFVWDDDIRELKAVIPASDFPAMVNTTGTPDKTMDNLQRRSIAMKAKKNLAGKD